MTSVLLLEQAGRWRAVATTILLLLIALPILPLGSAAFGASAQDAGEVFWQSLATSVKIAICGGVIGFVVGLPLGVGTALAAFPGRHALLAAIGLPLVVPSFLWAIGWSILATRQPLLRALTGGVSGCILTAATMTTALVVFASYAATLELSRSQVEAVLLAAGESALLRRASRNALVPAIFGAALGAVLALSDPGPGQILGTHTAAVEILTTFAARYDLALATKQCFILSLVVAGLALPLACIAGPRLAEPALPRQLTPPARRGKSALSVAVALAASAFLLFALGPPVGALLLPLVRGEPETLLSAPGLADAWSSKHLELALLTAFTTSARTALNTVLYAGGAGVLAVLIGTAIALSAGRSPRLRTVAVSICIVLFSWPSVASALGVVHLATTAPSVLDVLLRSRFTVCVVLASHLAPIATALALRATGALAPAWTQAAAIHGVAIHRYLFRVLWPALRPSATLSCVLVALLASADAGSVLLLHPPGEASLPLAIFTVMANAPEASVAALCLVYLLGTITVLIVALKIGQWELR